MLWKLPVVHLPEGWDRRTNNTLSYGEAEMLTASFWTLGHTWKCSGITPGGLEGPKGCICKANTLPTGTEITCVYVCVGLWLAYGVCVCGCGVCVCGGGSCGFTPAQQGSHHQCQEGALLWLKAHWLTPSPDSLRAFGQDCPTGVWLSLQFGPHTSGQTALPLSRVHTPFREPVQARCRALRLSSCSGSTGSSSVPTAFTSEGRVTVSCPDEKASRVTSETWLGPPQLQTDTRVRSLGVAGGPASPTWARVFSAQPTSLLSGVLLCDPTAQGEALFPPLTAPSTGGDKPLAVL